ncbi:pyridoxal phosphate-dependent aminotransferase [Pseudomaricurvus alkylphenolicus]|jgi:methionine aminotransferase|uniref:pyridoxal phosphate-dependent aminotransferase n=1 Tax=Pseudomaricurvus alkylphenolicus TaxID=1306991 RepID=UPI0014207447|nr:pyridoxal phosphate-dependent aminotransferase [Pseudomaricurvus alkylphenolicus]NIB42589.1 pyridoxal phosphate-dependent aminotransferase [Pseudomaricurvus alkylphenolicus]
MQPELRSKLPHVGTTIFTEISQLALDCQAINLGQGFPDFDGPDLLRERLCHYVQQGFNQYAPLAGIPKLREQIASKVKRLYGYNACPDTEVTVVPGATEAIYCAITACVGSGDEVIVFDPAYDCYEPTVALCGGKTIHIPLQPPKFGIDWQRVKDAVSPRTRMIILNSPHNPTGALLSAEDMQTLREVVKDTNILLLSDEVYEHLVYDGQQHESLLRYPDLMQRAFVVSSFGKTYHVTGWKTGYCVAPSLLTTELRKVHQYVTFVGITPIQWALADFMEACPQHCDELPAFYQKKRDIFLDAMASSRFDMIPTPGTYFQLAEYSAISDKTDREMVQWLTREQGVAAIPISVFYQQAPDMRYVRFCFAKSEATLVEAAKLLCQL